MPSDINNDQDSASCHPDDFQPVTGELLTRFFEANPALSFIKDHKGRYVYVSKSFGEFFKIPPETIIGKTDFDWLPKDVAGQFSYNDNLVRTSKLAIHTLEKVPQTDGVINSVVYKFPILMQDDTCYVGGIAVDITLRKASEELGRHLAAIVEFSRDAIFAESTDGIIASWNRGAEQMFGLKSEEIIGKPTQSLLQSPVSILLVEPGRRIEDYETTGLSKDGELLYLSITVSPIHNSEGLFLGNSVIARDISRRKRAEDEVAELNRELQKRVQELADLNSEVELARDRALEASRAKSLFLANMSHELRTPLSGILGLTELLINSKLSTDQKDLAESVLACGQSLLTLVNEILDLSRIESGKMIIQENSLDLRECLRSTVQTLSGSASVKGLKIETYITPELPAKLIGDPQRVQQILLNLIGNAVKFTEHGKVEISVEVDPEAGFHEETSYKVNVLISVRDTGIGIPEEKMPLLFKPFSQLDASATRKYGGTGLGLVISKSLIERMGGSIDVSSTVGAGSSFVARIPFRIDDGQLNRTNTEQSEPKTRLDGRVLIVDDNPTLLDLTLRQLSMFGLEAHACADAAEALKVLESESFDLILMDWHLPGMSGLDAVREIRERELITGKHVAVVAITASAMKGDAEQCFQAGMDDYLSKPVSLARLKETLTKWLPKVADRGSGGRTY